MQINEIYCKSILSKSGIYGIDYAVNPYMGCQHGCIYCYAVFMKKFANHKEAWGEFVDVKVNAPRVLAKQMKKSPEGSILISSVTDPYQPLERKYEITKKCLQVLSRYDVPISILTKSDLVLRDRTLLERVDAEVGVTFTTVEEDIRQQFEPGASSVEERLNILEEIEDCYVFFGPVIPMFSDTEEKIRAAFTAFAERGVTRLYIDKMNLYQNVWHRMKKYLDVDTVKSYKKIKDNEKYLLLLKKRMQHVLNEFDFDVTLGW